MKVLTCAQSRELEQSAVRHGMEYLELMENAGASAVRFLRKKFSLPDKRVVVLCGKGNNGGDGFVAARYLSELGAKVIAVVAEGLPVTEIAQTMYSRLNKTAVKVVSYFQDPEIVQPMLASADFILDAIYGTGFHGSVPENLFPLFGAVEKSKAIVVALDSPSGAVCDTGAVEGKCMEADYTISFSTLKVGHLMQPALSYCGQVVVVPIGVDSNLIRRQESSLEVTEMDEVRAMFPPRDPESNKGDYGRLLCVCGSEGMAGAAVLSGSAALRCGTGIVEEALPRSIYPIAASRLTEAVFTLMETERYREQLLSALNRSSACLIGCGIGKGEAASSCLNLVLKNARVPLIIDADGINLLAENIHKLEAVKAPVILTPHPGEMARLLKTTAEDVQAHRLEYAQRFAREHNVVLVLKGAGTIIAEPSGMTHLNMTGNAGMARGGSGDVLAGMIASLAAQRMEPAKAAVGAVYLHGMAGNLCAQEYSKTAMLPTDMVSMLPRVFLELESK
jgi:NAD(P)H-hydrate epimerase